MSTKPLYDETVISDADKSGNATPTSAAPIDIPTKGRADRRDAGERKRRPRRRAASVTSSISSQSGDSPTTPPRAVLQKKALPQSRLLLTHTLLLFVSCKSNHDCCELLIQEKTENYWQSLP